MHYGLGLKGTLALIAALNVNSSVSVLRLMHNNIPDEGLAQLIGCVATRPNLRELNISGNKMGGAACKALALLLGAR